MGTWQSQAAREPPRRFRLATSVDIVYFTKSPRKADVQETAKTTVQTSRRACDMVPRATQVELRVLSFDNQLVIVNNHVFISPTMHWPDCGS